VNRFSKAEPLKELRSRAANLLKPEAETLERDCTSFSYNKRI